LNILLYYSIALTIVFLHLISIFNTTLLIQNADFFIPTYFTMFPKVYNMIIILIKTLYFITFWARFYRWYYFIDIFDFI